MSPRGRRPAGSPDAREAILVAARNAFARDGYHTSLRGIAREAGVDPALVHHYFKDRAELFAEAVVASAAGASAVEISERAEAVAHLAPEELGEGIVRSFVGLWDGMGPDRFAAVIRAAMSSDESLAPFREFVTTGILGRIVGKLAPDQPELRGQLIASQLIGFGMARWMARMEGIAQLDIEEAVALVGPTIQRYATGEPPRSGD